MKYSLMQIVLLSKLEKKNSELKNVKKYKWMNTPKFNLIKKKKMKISNWGVLPPYYPRFISKNSTHSLANIIVGNGTGAQGKASTVRLTEK